MFYTKHFISTERLLLTSLSDLKLEDNRFVTFVGETSFPVISLLTIPGRTSL